MLPAALKMPLTTLVRTARTGLTSPLLAWALMVVRLLLGRDRVGACEWERRGGVRQGVTLGEWEGGRRIGGLHLHGRVSGEW